MEFIRPIEIEPEWLTKTQIYMLDRSPVEVAPEFRVRTLPSVEAKVVRELLERRKLAANAGKASDGVTPNEWLRVTLYAVILRWLAHFDGEEILDRVPRKLQKSRKISGNEAHGFHLLIGAVLAGNPEIITPTERDRLAQPMWHAFRNYIPPALLLGFNHQYPAHRKASATVPGHVEPELFGWVREQRLYATIRKCPLDERRGDYPHEIDDHVQTEYAKLIDSNVEAMRRFPELVEAIKRLI